MAHLEDQLNPHVKYEFNLSSHFWDNVRKQMCDDEAEAIGERTKLPLYATQHKCLWHKKVEKYTSEVFDRPKHNFYQNINSWFFNIYKKNILMCSQI